MSVHTDQGRYLRGELVRGIILEHRMMRKRFSVIKVGEITTKGFLDRHGVAGGGAGATSRCNWMAG